MSKLVGSWSGYFGYSDGTRRLCSFDLQKNATDDNLFIGSGKDSSGPFDLLCGQALSVGPAATVITFVQHYPAWTHSFWTFTGELSADGQTMTGSWFDPPNVEAHRKGTFVATRGTVEPAAVTLAGEWKGTYSYPNQATKEFSISIPVSGGSGTAFVGKGNDGGEFTIHGQCVVSKDPALRSVSWVQTYDSKWFNQFWYWDGLLNASGKEIEGNWHDSNTDGRGRTAHFVLKRA